MDLAPFSVATAITPAGAGRYLADLHPGWTIAGKPNGGYLLGVMGRVAVATDLHPHVIAASAHYLASPDTGPVELEVETLRAGRSASQLRVRMSREGRHVVEALITTAALQAGTTPAWSGGAPDPDAFDAPKTRLPSTSPSGFPVAIMEQVDLRVNDDDLGFGVGRPSGRGRLAGSLELPAGEDFDPLSLLFAIDALPPATFDVRPSGWVPTLELTGYIRALPQPGPVRILQRAQLVEADRVDEVCTVWDSAGRLVAQGTQLAGVRFSD